MRNELSQIINSACHDLLLYDGALFSCEIERDIPYDSRKLHEVCINHKFANYLEKHYLHNFPDESLYCDIEFNREGIEKKELSYNGNLFVVRPDIILHNRRSGREKRNILVVECKKHGASVNELNEDKQKLVAFMTDTKYQYQFGLQVVYDQNRIYGSFFYFDNGSIVESKINVS
jgi:hypothetical protein